MRSENFAKVAADRSPRHWNQLRNQVEQVEAYRLIAHPTAEDASAAAEAIGVSRATFYRLVRAYEIPKSVASDRPRPRRRTIRRLIDVPGVDIVLDVAPLDLEASQDGGVSLVGLLAMIDRAIGTVIKATVFGWPPSPSDLADLVLSAPRWRQPTPAVVARTPGTPTLSPRFHADWHALNMLPPIPVGNGLETGGAIEAAFGRTVGTMRVLRRLPRRSRVSPSAVELTDVSAIVDLTIERHNHSLRGRTSSDI